MVSGFILAALVWAYFVAPLIRAEYLTIDDPILITVIFTFVSFVRGYFWRRFFNAGIQHMVKAGLTKIYGANT